MTTSEVTMIAEKSYEEYRRIVDQSLPNFAFTTRDQQLGWIAAVEEILSLISWFERAKSK